jgi:hypothetical protein
MAARDLFGDEPERDAQLLDVRARWSRLRTASFPRIDDALEFARRSRVLLMRHAGSAIDLDITFGGLSFEQSAVERGAVHFVGGVSVRLPRVEDLLVMKAVARRPKDLDDINALLDAHPQTELTEVRAWVREFAGAAGMPEVLRELDELLARRRR